MLICLLSRYHRITDYYRNPLDCCREDQPITKKISLSASSVGKQIMHTHDLDKVTFNYEIYNTAKLTNQLLVLFVYDVYISGFLCILTFIILLTRSSSSSALMRVIGGGSIRACTYALIQFSFWVIFVVVCLGFEEWKVVFSHVVSLQSAIFLS